MVWPDGTVRWIHGKGRFAYDGKGHAQRMTGVVADITETMQNLRTLQEKQARLSAVFDGSPQCIKLLDRHGIVREMNPAGLALLGVGETQAVIGQPVASFVAPEYRDQTRPSTTVSCTARPAGPSSRSCAPTASVAGSRAMPCR